MEAADREELQSGSSRLSTLMIDNLRSGVKSAMHAASQLPGRDPLMFVCVEVLRPSQPNGVMSSAVSLPNHTYTGQA